MSIELRKFSLLLSSSVLLICFVSMLLICGVISIRKTTFSENSIYEYKYLEFNEVSNYSSIGTVRIFERLADGEYIHHVGENDNHIIISNFGNDEYYCSGYCFCGKGIDERRSSLASNVVKRGLNFFVVAISTLFALEKAKEYFKNECAEQLADSCSLSSVNSEVDQCEKIISDESEIDGKKSYRFICSGECMYSQTFRPKRPGYYSTTDEFEIQRHLFCEDLTLKSIDIELGPEISWDEKNFTPLEIAKWKFVRDHLNGYCIKETRRTIRFITEEYDVLKKRMHLCVGSHRGGKGNHGINPSVHCQRS